MNWNCHFQFICIAFNSKVEFSWLRCTNPDCFWNVAHQSSYSCVGPPHAEEHQCERWDLRHGARRRQPVGHCPGESGQRDQETALQSEPTGRCHPAVETEPEYFTAQPDRWDEKQIRRWKWWFSSFHLLVLIWLAKDQDWVQLQDNVNIWRTWYKSKDNRWFVRAKEVFWGHF